MKQIIYITLSSLPSAMDFRQTHPSCKVGTCAQLPLWPSMTKRCLETCRSLPLMAVNVLICGGETKKGHTFCFWNQFIVLHTLQVTETVSVQLTVDLNGYHLWTFIESCQTQFCHFISWCGWESQKCLIICQIILK